MADFPVGPSGGGSGGGFNPGGTSGTVVVQVPVVVQELKAVVVVH